MAAVVVVTAAEKLADGDEDGVGQVGATAGVRKLPYDLDFTTTTTRVEPPTCSRARQW